MYLNRFADRLLDENKQLKRTIEMYESENNILLMKKLCEKQVRSAQEREKKQHDGWMKCLETNKELKSRNTKLWEEKEDYKGRLKRSLRDQGDLETKLKIETARRSRAEEKAEKLEKEKAEAEAINAALKEEICRLRAQIDHDGTTNGIPTSQTPVNKKKVIPNTREKSGRTRGGQTGHEKHSMKNAESLEVAEITDHPLETCPECGGELEELAEETNKDEVEYEVKVVRKRHRFPKYRCKNCGKTVRANIPKHLKESVQYGAGIQALALALVDLGFVSIGRTKKILGGILQGKVEPSEGFIGKVQKKGAGKLKEFREEVRKCCLSQRILHWDDTVVFMNTAKACFRFYGNERLALYYAHKAKDAAGLEQDGVLQYLTEETHLMHDHLKINYRKEFLFKNIECVEHLERELQKVYNESEHKWAHDMKELISGMIHKRKERKKEGENSFTDEETNRFEEKLEQYLAEGKRKSVETKERYFHRDEVNAIKKIEEYKENYFAWVYDFTLPTTNNLAESGLRMTKSKMKISGQFEKEETAEEFALIRTYTETCRRNGVNEFRALERLMAGNPYTLAEIMA